MRKPSKCNLCNKIAILTRNYCPNCYQKLIRQGILKKINNNDLCPQEFTQEQKEILTGMLLGDACIFQENHTKYPYLSVSRKLSDIEYAKYQFETFKDFCKQEKIKETSIFDKRTNKFYYQAKFATRRIQIFELYYDKWYCKKKIIPVDLSIKDLTPLVCAIWFCDDGCVYTPHKKYKRLALKLSTHGFSYEENVRLCEMLKEKFNEHFSVRYDDGNYYLAAADAGTKEFINYIKDHIPKSMNRKITWTNDQLLIEKAFAQLKNRDKFDFNKKEKDIINIFLENQPITPRQISQKIGWIPKNKQTPTGLMLYLQRFCKYKWIVTEGLHNHKKYKITELGIKELSSLFSKFY